MIPHSSEISGSAAPQLAHARQALHDGHPEAARQILSRLPTNQRASPHVAYLLGIAAQGCNDNTTAVDCFRRALPALRNDPVLHMRLGIALYSLGQIHAATRALRHACQLAPDSATAWYNLGEVLKTDVQQAPQALDAFVHALRLDPTLASARISLARIKASLGDIDAAVQAFRSVLQHDPTHAEAWFGLSDLNVTRFNDSDVKQLAHACMHARLDTESGNLLAFAYGKALEQQGCYAQAFETFRAANTAWRSHVVWDATAEHAHIDRIMRTFNDWTPPPPIDSELGRGVIFIVSLPRSGSSLVEHMLAAHPRVEGANEIADMSDLLREESRRRGHAFPVWVRDATADDWHRLGTDYLARTALWRQHKPGFTDKNLLNWQWVGAIIAMLPAARIVIVRRDPLETCLACFRQRFAHDVGFSYGLDDLAKRYADFMQLARLWRRQYPNHVFDLAYEHFVDDPAAGMHKLLTFCGLPFDAACLSAHRARRTVASAPSAAQVREPVHRNIPRASRYGAALSSLRQHLQAAGIPDVHP